MQRKYVVLFVTLLVCFFANMTAFLPAIAQGRPDLVWMRGGNSYGATSLAYSPDGTMVSTTGNAIGGDDATVKINRASDGMLLRTFNHAAQVSATVFTPDSKNVIAADNSLKIEVRRLSDGAVIGSWSTPSNALAIALSPDGKLLASGDGDDKVRLWRVPDGAPIGVLQGHTGPVSSVAFSPNGQFLASASGLNNDSSVRVWRVSDMSPLQNITSSIYTDYRVAFTVDSQDVVLAGTVYSGSPYVSLAYWRVSDGGSVGAFTSAPQQRLHSFALSPDGQSIAFSEGVTATSGNGSSHIEIHRISDGMLVHTYLQTGFDVQYQIAYSPDGKVIAAANPGAGSGSYELAFIRSSDGTTISSSDPYGIGSYPRQVAVTSDGQKMVEARNAIIVRRASDGAPIYTLPYSSNIALSADGALLAGSSNGDISFWRTADGTLVRTIKGFDINTSIQNFSPDGQWIATSDGGIYRVADGTLVKQLSAAGYIAFSPDGKVIAVCNFYGSISIFSTSDWTLVRSTFAGDVFAFAYGMAFSPDSQTLAVGGGSTNSRYGGGAGTKLLRISDGTWLRTLPSPTDVKAVAFSPDGQVITVSSADAYFTLWSAFDGTLLSLFNDETGTAVSGTATGVNPIAYSPDGKYIFYGRTDGVMCAALNPFGNTFFPNHGGNTGNVTFKSITPANFPVTNGTQVKLVAVGQPDIIAQSITHLNSQVLTGTFNLNGTTLGMRDVIITNTDGTTRTYPMGFKVEQGVAPKFTTDILGYTALRASRLQLFYGIVYNAGNIDVDSVNLRIQIPNYLDYKLTEGQPIDVITSEQNTAFSIQTGLIPATESKVIPIQLKAPDNPIYAHQDLPLWSWVNVPSENNAEIYGGGGETLFFKGVSSKNDTVSVFGTRETNGLPNGATSVVIQVSSGLALTVSLDQIERPIKISGTDGSVCTINWLDNRYADITFTLSDGSTFGPVLADLGQDYNQITVLARPTGDQLCMKYDDLRKSVFRVGTASAIILTVVAVAAGPTLPILAAGATYYAAGMGGLALIATPGDGFWPNTLKFMYDTIITSGDPNDFSGSSGYGDSHWVGSTQPLQYKVSFSNEPDASAPAATVNVTETLDAANLDMTTFKLGTIAFADWSVTPTDDKALPLVNHPFDQDVDLTKAIPYRNLVVRVHAQIDILTGNLMVSLTSLDPVTLMTPDDPLAGFLDAGKEGSISFSVVPKSTVPTGTVTQEQATVIFDANPAMNTPVWRNTLDNDAPMSGVNMLPAQSPASFTVKWVGTDTIANVTGSDVKDYTIYVSDNGGPFMPWLTSTTDTQAMYVGMTGHTYGFISQARDNVYNLEPLRTQADVTTTVVPSVSGTITLKGCTNMAQPITFQFRPTDGSSSFTRTATLNADGTFQFLNIPASSYNVAIKGAIWLQKAVAADTTNGSVSGLTATLLGGDADNNNIVDINDFSIVVNAFGSALNDGTGNYDSNADFSCDGMVDIGDFGILVNNYGLSGDL